MKPVIFRIITLLIIAITIAATQVSCVSYERCVARYGRTPGDTIYMPYEVIIPPDSITTILMIDSIPYMMPGDTVFVEDPRSRARISYWRDAYKNAINIRADCDTIVIRDTIAMPFPVVLDPPPPGRLARAWDAWKQAAGWVLIAFILIFIIRTIVKLLK